MAGTAYSANDRMGATSILISATGLLGEAIEECYRWPTRSMIAGGDQRFL